MIAYIPPITASTVYSFWRFFLTSAPSHQENLGVSPPIPRSGRAKPRIQHTKAPFRLTRRVYRTGTMRMCHSYVPYSHTITAWIGVIINAKTRRHAGIYGTIQSVFFFSSSVKYCLQLPRGVAQAPSHPQAGQTKGKLFPLKAWAIGRNGVLTLRPQTAEPIPPGTPSRMAKNSSESQRSPLDHLHSKVNDDASGIKGGSLGRPRDLPPAGEVAPQYMDSLLSSLINPTASRQDAGSLPTSDQEFPEPSALLVGKKKRSASSDSNSYDDSELDQWAANIPSEILDLDEDESIFFPISEHVRPIGQPSKSGAPLPPKGTKRQITLTEEPEPHGRDTKRPKPLPVKNNESVIDLDTPVRKKQTVEALPTPLSASPPQREVVSSLFCYRFTHKRYCA